MANIYSWVGEGKNTIRKLTSDSEMAWFFPPDEENKLYQEYLLEVEQGLAEPATSFVAPPPPTPEEKLAASGLTVDELKQLLGIK